MALTPKQEKFCHGIVSGLNQSDAYRAAYDCDGMLDTTINNEGYKLSQNHEISTRIEQLKLPIAERVGRTLQQHIERLQYLSDRSDKLDKLEASIKSEELIGKVLGYYVNKSEITGKDGNPIQHSITREILDPKVEE